VDTPLHKKKSKDFLKALSPMVRISDVKDIVEAVVYLQNKKPQTRDYWSMSEIGIYRQRSL
jgi:hypothetical protein